jgi:Ankyrin repeats (3 copies)
MSGPSAVAFPRWFKIAGLVLLAGSLVYVTYVVYGEIFEYDSGYSYRPLFNLYLFALSKNPVFLIGFFFIPGSLVWLSAAVWLLARSKKRPDTTTCVLLVALAALIGLLFVSGNALQLRYVQLFGPGSRGNEFLTKGVVRGNQRLVVKLLDKGFDVNGDGHRDGMPLSAAVAMHNSDMIRFLISKGARVDEPDPQLGDTPLMDAAVEGKMEIVRILLESGAHPCLQNKKGRTAEGLAKEFGRMGVAKYLSQFHCAEVDPCADPSTSVCVHP